MEKIKKGVFINRTGEKHLTKEKYWTTITECFNCKNCTIQFEDGTTLKNMRYDHIKEGSIRYPFHPSNYGIGYLGIGKYRIKIGDKFTKSGTIWSGVIRRCYNEKERNKFPSYIGVTICEEWKCFQNFAKWFEDNYIEGFHVDKDILIKGNKIYSPETCCFVPSEVNCIFTKSDKARGNLPIGVSLHKGGKFQAKMLKNKKQCYLGLFDTVEEAFQVYKTAKELWIKEVAKIWKSQITERCYQALINYQVEITD